MLIIVYIIFKWAKSYLVYDAKANTKSKICKYSISISTNQGYIIKFLLKGKKL